MVEEENYQIFLEHLIIGEAEAEEQDILQQEEMVVQEEEVVVLWEQQREELDILMDLLAAEEQQIHKQIHQEEMELLIQEAEVEGVRI
jgi:hypothetical protein